MNAIERKISSHPFFISMDPEQVKSVSKNAKEVAFTEGEILFDQGEPANRLFLIESGRVALDERCGPKCDARIQILAAGDALGWSWLFPPFSWHFRARAIEPTRAIVLDGGHLLVTCERDSAFGYDLMKRIARIAINRLENCQCRMSTQSCDCA